MQLASTRSPSKYNYVRATNEPVYESPKKRKTVPKTCLSYNINELESIPTSAFGRIAISLNPFTPPHPSLVQGVWEYTTTPKINAGTVTAMSNLSTIQNKRGLSFCVGWSWCGFWEDAITAGLLVAIEHLGACVPFAVDDHLRDGSACARRGSYDGDGEDGIVRGTGLFKVDHRLRDHAIKSFLRVVYMCILITIILWYVSLAGLRRLPGKRMTRFLLGGLR